MACVFSVYSSTPDSHSVGGKLFCVGTVGKRRVFHVYMYVYMLQYV